MAVVARSPEAIKRPKFSPERPGGFRKVPTFQELAQVKPPPREQPIRRDATEYFNSFEAAWLRGPVDEIRDKANEIQTREAIRLLAEKQAKNLNIPVPAIMGDMKRQFQRPELMIGNPDNLQRETVFPTQGRAALDELLNKNYANPAGPNGVTESQNNKRTNDILEAILKIQAERMHREGAAREFAGTTSAGTTSDDLRSAADWVERRFDIPAGAVRFATERIGARMGMFGTPAAARAGDGFLAPRTTAAEVPAPEDEDERRMAQAEEDERLTAAASRRRRTLPERPPPAAGVERPRPIPEGRSRLRASRRRRTPERPPATAAASTRRLRGERPPATAAPPPPPSREGRPRFLYVPGITDLEEETVEL